MTQIFTPARSVSASFGAALLCVFLAAGGQEPSRHAPDDANVFQITQDGTWDLPLRYWSKHPPFFELGQYIFLTEVMAVGRDIPPVEQQEWPLRFRTGTLRLKEVLYS